MAEWKEVTDYFTEEQRHYKNTYLELDEVYNEELELSIFSSLEDGPWEIYFSYGRFYGIVYADADEAYEIRERMKKELEEAYNITADPTDEFIQTFVKKYKVELPMDTFIDFDF